MARGWESKAVEAQQAEASDSRHLGPPVTRDAASRQSKLTTLRLARTRAENDLQHATASAHRSMLERAIEELDRQIAELR